MTAKEKENRGFLEEIIDEVDAMAHSALREAEEFTSDLIGGSKSDPDDKYKDEKLSQNLPLKSGQDNLASSLSKKNIEWQRYVELKKEADLAQKSAEEAYRKYCEIK